MMALRELQLDLELDSTLLPSSVVAWINLARREIEEFWDQSSNSKKTEYVESDFEHVAEVLLHCQQKSWLARRELVEWGCGFGVVTGIAELLGLPAVGIESEGFLVEAGRRLLQKAGISAELFHGNFLPAGAAELALVEDPRVALQSTMPSVYASINRSLTDFGCVFCYAWPGEEHFLKLVFDRFAAPGTLLVLYRGPYHIEVYRKL